MSFRRLTPPVVVLTGVENSGKTTLAKALANALDWTFVPEKARTDAAVVQGDTRLKDLQRLLAGHERSVRTLAATSETGILCDTGPLVLERWSLEAFGQPLRGALAAQKKVDFYLLCHTLTDWEPDPLRHLPRYEDRLLHQKRFIEHLEEHQLPWAMVPKLPEGPRLLKALELMAQRPSKR